MCCFQLPSFVTPHWTFSRLVSSKYFQTHQIFLHSPFLEDPEGGGLDAVGGPGGVAALVADRDGEAAEVCPHEVDDPALLALDVQRGALAPVLGPPLRTWSWGFH